MDKIEKIRAEIKRRLKKAEYEMAIARGISHDNFIIHQAELNLCMFLLDFIDTIQQEPPEVELEKELDKYLRGEFQQTAGGNFNNYIQVARHFAEWGANHLRDSTKMVDKDLEEAAEEYATTHLRNNEYPTADSAFIAGSLWKEEQMMKDAVEGEIVDSGFDDGTAILKAIVPDSRYDSGDKVIVFVIKED